LLYHITFLRKLNLKMSIMAFFDTELKIVSKCDLIKQFDLQIFSDNIRYTYCVFICNFLHKAVNAIDDSYLAKHIRITKATFV